MRKTKITIQSHIRWPLEVAVTMKQWGAFWRSGFLPYMFVPSLSVNLHLRFLFFFSFLFFFFSCLGPHPWHMEFPRPGVKLELQLLTCATATAKPDLSCVCNLHHISWQQQILNPLSEARDQTCILLDTSPIRFH